MEKTHTLHVTGMHCKSCTLIVKETVIEIPWVKNAHVNLQQQTVQICCEDLEPDELNSLINLLLEESGYRMHLKKPSSTINRKEYIIAFLIASVLIFFFSRLQNLGLLDLIHSDKRTYGISFFIGFVASLSSCLAVVGWIVLALGAAVARQTKSSKPQWMFHLGRLGGFFLLWGILGLIGSAFKISPTITTVLNIVIGIVLFIFGLNLLGIIRSGVTLWGGTFKRLSTKGGLTRWPLLLGIGTFFAPCGFTQSMQIYTLTTGNFWIGWLTMLSFAMGTLPMLLFLSFTSKNIQTSKYSSLFFKVIWVILLALWIFNIINNLAVLWIIPPLFNF